MKDIIFKSFICGAMIGISFITIIFILIDGLYSYLALLPAILMLIFPTIVLKGMVKQANKEEQEKEINKTISSIGV